MGPIERLPFAGSNLKGGYLACYSQRRYCDTRCEWD